MDEEDIPADVSELIREGTIASVDLAARRCTVRFGDEDDEDGGATTPPIRWLAGRCGKTRKWSPPSEGEQVVLLCPDGQIANAIALLGIEQELFPLPGNDESENTTYDDGAVIGYDPITHALTAFLPAGGTALVDAPGGMIIRGPVTIEGTLNASGAITSDDDVLAGSISLKGHKHGGVQSGASQTGAPV